MDSINARYDRLEAALLNRFALTVPTTAGNIAYRNTLASLKQRRLRELDRHHGRSAKKPAHFRVLTFKVQDKGVRYVAIAWNYEQAVLVSSRDHATYTAARQELDDVCADLRVELRWFQGEYEAEEGCTFPPV